VYDLLENYILISDSDESRYYYEVVSNEAEYSVKIRDEFLKRKK